MDINQKIEYVKKQLAITPNNNKLRIELKRLIAERNDRLDMLLTPNVNQTKKTEIIETTTDTTSTESLQINNKKIYFTSEKLNEGFWWDYATGLATFDSGAVYTEQEVRALCEQNIPTQVLTTIHSQKKIFPQLRYVDTIVKGGQSDYQQEDELDLLFKNLKG
jgi:hypothetical protein